MPLNRRKVICYSSCYIQAVQAPTLHIHPPNHRKLVEFYGLTHFTHQCLWLTHVYSSYKERILKRETGIKEGGGKVNTTMPQLLLVWVTKAWNWTKATLLIALHKSKNSSLSKPQWPKRQVKQKPCPGDRQNLIYSPLFPISNGNLSPQVSVTNVFSWDVTFLSSVNILGHAHTLSSTAHINHPHRKITD